MIYKKSNLLDHLVSGIIVHGCNAQGVMGAGFAKDIKAKYPKMFDKYSEDIKMGRGLLGDVSWYVAPMVYIASGITQEFYGRDGKKYVSYDAVDSVMSKVFAAAYHNGLSVHMPKIGSGFGGGDWEVIEKIIDVNATRVNFDPDKIMIWEL